MSHAPNFELTCPIPIQDYPHVSMAHGGGGRLMNQLIQEMFVSTFSNPHLNAQHDGALLKIDSGSRLAFSTDSYVVQPLFFPGGDIGALAINGTVNDLAMCGAKPRYLSAGFIIEEGFAMETLWRIVQSMQQAAQKADVTLVTGDTKVVDRGKGDGIYINTAGIGIVSGAYSIGPTAIRSGDAILISGDIGRHGMAIMAVREGLAFETDIESDCAPLVEPVQMLLESGINVHCLRDLTRGGLASALVEIATAAPAHLHLTQAHIPVREDVQGACEILGFDPIYVANEGRFTAFVAEKDADRALELLHQHPLTQQAARIGTVQSVGERAGRVIMRSEIGASRIIDMLSGEQLPRIC